MRNLPGFVTRGDGTLLTVGMSFSKDYGKDEEAKQWGKILCEVSDLCSVHTGNNLGCWKSVASGVVCGHWRSEGAEHVSVIDMM